MDKQRYKTIEPPPNTFKKANIPSRGTPSTPTTNGASTNSFANAVVLAPTSGNSHHFFLGMNGNSAPSNATGSNNSLFNTTASNPLSTNNPSQPISPRSRLRKHDEYVKENMIPEWDLLMQPLKGKQSYITTFPSISQQNLDPQISKANAEMQQQNVLFFSRLQEISFLQIESIKLEKKERKSKFI